MVSPEDTNFLWVFYFEGEEKTDGFDALTSSIDVISKEEIWWFGREVAVFEESEHIVVLSMNISADFDGGIDFYEHGLFHEDGFDCAYESEYILFIEFD